MSFARFNRGLWIGSAPPGFDQSFNTSTTFFESQTIDAGTEKCAFIGRFWHPEHTSKAIRYVHWRSLTTGGGGSSIDLTIQGVSTTATPLQPDGTPVATVTFTVASLGTGGWHTTAALSADVTKNPGDRFAVVWEYNGASRTAPDSVNVSGHRRAGYNGDGPDGAFYSGAAWTNPSTGTHPIVIFECTDGTFGTFDESFPCKTVTSVAYNSGSSPNEYALQFTVPVAVVADAAIVLMSVAGATSDFDLILYDGTTALATVSYTGDALRGTSAYGILFPFGSDITLTPDKTYYISLKPTTANNVSLHYFEMNATGHFDVHSGGQTWVMAHRAGGAWTNGWGSSLRRPKVSLRVCEVGYSNPFAVDNCQLILPPSVIGY